MFSLKPVQLGWSYSKEICSQTQTSDLKISQVYLFYITQSTCLVKSDWWQYNGICNMQLSSDSFTVSMYNKIIFSLKYVSFSWLCHTKAWHPYPLLVQQWSSYHVQRCIDFKSISLVLSHFTNGMQCAILQTFLMGTRYLSIGGIWQIQNG